MMARLTEFPVSLPGFQVAGATMTSLHTTEKARCGT
jgi:hypothetical protein